MTASYKTINNIKITILCSFFTLLVLLGTIGIGNLLWSLVFEAETCSDKESNDQPCSRRDLLPQRTPRPFGYDKNIKKEKVLVSCDAPVRGWSRGVVCAQKREKGKGWGPRDVEMRERFFHSGWRRGVGVNTRKRRRLARLNDKGVFDLSIIKK